MQIRHLRNSKIITEILILCVAYISMAAGVYIGIAGNDTSKAYYSLIVIIPDTGFHCLIQHTEQSIFYSVV